MKYDYKIVRNIENKLLTELGQQGWLLVCVTHSRSDRYDQARS